MRKNVEIGVLKPQMEEEGAKDAISGRYSRYFFERRLIYLRLVRRVSHYIESTTRGATYFRYKRLCNKAVLLVRAIASVIAEGACTVARVRLRMPQTLSPHSPSLINTPLSDRATDVGASIRYFTPFFSKSYTRTLPEVFRVAVEAADQARELSRG